ncbi:MAG: tRNA pseudouridine(13) synthase TruD [Euryarchaeota archaeon]|nr:tRNA pseudouridine(13) synthase TruD [Euryarchaeota archaeon]
MRRSWYELDNLLGMRCFISDTPGIGGRLRQRVEDFVVRERFEVCDDGEGEYLHFIMEKYNWDTIRAIMELSRRLGVSSRRFGYAGTKDKRAYTVQRVSARGVSEERLRSLSIPGIKLHSFTKCRRGISLGDLLGNEFEIVIREVSENAEEVVPATSEQLESRGVPNYFGYQRFGTVRPNTHIVGRAILRGELEEAVACYIGRPYPREKQDAREARRIYDETSDPEAALQVFPERLQYERLMLAWLRRHPSDYAGAIRRLPKKLRKLLVHAYQGYLFNLVLSRMIEEGMDIRGRSIPIFGYRSRFSEGRQGEIEREVLEQEGVELESFRCSSMPELAQAGGMRSASVSAEMSWEVAQDELNPGMVKLTVRFFLPPGSYATSVLREYMKADPLSY